MLDAGCGGGSYQAVGLDTADTTSSGSRSPVRAELKHLDLGGLTPWDQWNDDQDHALPIPGIWPELRAADAA